MANKFTQEELWKAAKFVFDALKEVGETECCLVGGAALFLHGVKRDVNRRIQDLDIIIFGKSRQVLLKESLSRRFPNNFCLKDPRQPSSHYLRNTVKPNTDLKLLMYKVPGKDYSIKIDLLMQSEPAVEITGRLGISHTVVKDGFPVAPLEFLLYHKLLGWERRSTSTLRHNLEKAKCQDYNDIIEVYRLIRRQQLSPLRVPYIGALYTTRLQARVQRFIISHGERERRRFRVIGFAV
ncbi:hypothetical protein FRC18_010960 [Serendipita sp. 400]|nr:hypothetical protein FRC18_010960 [Serendipita sp. 400]